MTTDQWLAFSGISVGFATLCNAFVLFLHIRWHQKRGDYAR